MDKHLNIVSFDNPYPPIYGGVIDVYYKILALSRLGVKIHLHYFSKNTSDISYLNEICEEVFIYKRKAFFYKQISALPYIINSRTSEKLNTELRKNNYPILFEGIHTTKVLLDNPELFNRSIIRHHNIEDQYYLGLFNADKNILNRLYYLIESNRLKNYLKKISDAAFHLTITDDDKNSLSALSFKNIITIGPFHSTEKYNHNSLELSNNKFVLYHGNLNVSENKKAVDYLLDKIFINKSIEYVIAGSNNSEALRSKIKDYSNIKLVENPTSEEIDNLIQQAAVIALPTFQNTGIKLKLIESLFKGRHVITNEMMSHGFPESQLFSIAKSAEEFIDLINTKINNPFTEAMRIERISILNIHFSNENNAKKIIEILENISGQ